MSRQSGQDEISEGAGQKLYRRAKEIIPGGTQLLSKRPEMFLPEQWPAYYASAKGCEVTDLDGRVYQDFSIMGVGSCILGYADPDVTAAVVKAVQSGNMCTLNAPEEVELAELLLELHPWAEMVRYARTGGEAMAIAVRLARAASGKDVVLFCGYHGWSDWYLAANLAGDNTLDGHLLPGLEPAGVPRALCETAVPFRFNDTEGFRQAFERYKDRVGAIVMEPIRNDEPDPEFREAVQRTAEESGIPLVIDEITAGFRLTVGGAHLVTGWKPDVAVFAKGMSNGHPMAAIIGKASVMESAQRSFVSSTYWTDRTGPAAALATIRKMRTVNSPEVLHQIGEDIQRRWEKMIYAMDLDAVVGGVPALTHISFSYDPFVWKTAFVQEMVEKGYLCSTGIYVSTAHIPSKVDRYFTNCQEVLSVLSEQNAHDGGLSELINGPVCHNGFQRLN